MRQPSSSSSSNLPSTLALLLLLGISNPLSSSSSSSSSLVLASPSPNPLPAPVPAPQRRRPKFPKHRGSGSNDETCTLTIHYTTNSTTPSNIPPSETKQLNGPCEDVCPIEPQDQEGGLDLDLTGWFDDAAEQLGNDALSELGIDRSRLDRVEYVECFEQGGDLWASSRGGAGRGAGWSGVVMALGLVVAGVVGAGL